MDHTLGQSLTRHRPRHERRALALLLNEWNVPDADERAALLCDAGLAELRAEWRPLLASVQGAEVCQFVYDFVSVVRSSTIVDAATGKMSRFIAELRKSLASRLQESHKLPVNVGKSLELVAELYQARLPSGANLVLELEPNLWVLARPGTLMQVWSNLLTNELEVVAPGSTLRLGLRRSESGVEFAMSCDTPRRPRDNEIDIDAETGLSIAKEIVLDLGGRWIPEKTGNLTLVLPKIPHKETDHDQEI